MPEINVEEHQKFFDNIEELSSEEVMKLLHATAFEYHDEVWWREDYKGRLLFYVGCNDLFYWGSADAEPITPQNLNSLIETIAEVEEIKGKYRAWDAFELWCCRQRKMRPQPPYYKSIDSDLHELFNACGPERTAKDLI